MPILPDRFVSVVPGVYRGGKPNADQLKILHDKYNVKRIISLDANVGQEIAPFVKQLGMEHIIVPLTATETNITEPIRYLQRNISNLFNNRPVYIHCYQGKDRTGLAVALFRIKNGTNRKQAIREAKNLGFGIGLQESTKNLYTKIILLESDVNSANDIVTQERMTHEPMSQADVFDSRHTFGPITPVFEHPRYYHHSKVDDSDKIRKRRRKLRRMMLQDVNDVMAQVGMYYNNNPMLRGLGPIEPVGIMPPSFTFSIC